MIDISGVHTGEDLHVFNTQTCQAANILSVQVGSLEYAPDLGIDLSFFLSNDFKFQNDSFKAYLIEVLANFGINVSSLVDTVDNLFEEYTFNLSPQDTGSTALVR